MRPRSIITFERLFVASLVVSAVGLALSFGDASAVWNNDPNVRRVGLGSGFLIGGMALSYALYLLLWYLIARKASNVARSILVVLVVVSLLSILSALKGPWTLTTVLGLVGYALEIAALVFLFKPDASAWLKGEHAGNEATFD